MAKRFEFIILSREISATDPLVDTLSDISKVEWMCTRGGAIDDLALKGAFSKKKSIELEYGITDHRKQLGLPDPF